MKYALLEKDLSTNAIYFVGLFDDEEEVEIEIDRRDDGSERYAYKVEKND